MARSGKQRALPYASTFPFSFSLPATPSPSFSSGHTDPLLFFPFFSSILLLVFAYLLSSFSSPPHNSTHSFPCFLLWHFISITFHLVWRTLPSFLLQVGVGSSSHAVRFTTTRTPTNGAGEPSNHGWERTRQNGQPGMHNTVIGLSSIACSFFVFLRAVWSLGWWHYSMVQESIVWMLPYAWENKEGRIVNLRSRTQCDSVMGICDNVVT